MDLIVEFRSAPYCARLILADKRSYSDAVFPRCKARIDASRFTPVPA